MSDHPDRPKFDPEIAKKYAHVNWEDVPPEIQIFTSGNDALSRISLAPKPHLAPKMGFEEDSLKSSSQTIETPPPTPRLSVEMEDLPGPKPQTMILFTREEGRSRFWVVPKPILIGAEN